MSTCDVTLENGDTLNRGFKELMQGVDFLASAFITFLKVGKYQFPSSPYATALHYIYIGIGLHMQVHGVKVYTCRLTGEVQ